MKKIVCGVLFAFVMLLTACGSGSQKKNGEIGEEKFIKIMEDFCSREYNYDVESTFVQDPDNEECEIGYEFDFQGGYVDEENEDGIWFEVSYSRYRRNKETGYYVNSSDLVDDPNSFYLMYNSKGNFMVKPGFYYAKNLDGDSFNPLTDFKSISYKEFIKYAKIDLWQLSYKDIEDGYTRTDTKVSISLKLKGDDEKSEFPLRNGHSFLRGNEDYAIRLFEGETILEISRDSYNKLIEHIQNANKAKSN